MRGVELRPRRESLLLGWLHILQRDIDVVDLDIGLESYGKRERGDSARKTDALVCFLFTCWFDHNAQCGKEGQRIEKNKLQERLLRVCVCFWGARKRWTESGGE